MTPEMQAEKMEMDKVELMPEDVPENLDQIIPSMNVGVPQTQPEPDQNLIKDEQLLGIYKEIMTSIESDKKEISDVLNFFVDLVVNDGDSTTSSKESLVNLLKLKTDQADKMTRVADLMTRLKLKERDTFPRYLAAHQTNQINIGDNGQKKALLEMLNKQKKEKK